MDSDDPIRDCSTVNVSSRLTDSSSEGFNALPSRDETVGWIEVKLDLNS